MFLLSVPSRETCRKKRIHIDSQHNLQNDSARVLLETNLQFFRFQLLHQLLKLNVTARHHDDSSPIAQSPKIALSWTQRISYGTQSTKSENQPCMQTTKSTNHDQARKRDWLHTFDYYSHNVVRHHTLFVHMAMQVTNQVIKWNDKIVSVSYRFLTDHR